MSRHASDLCVLLVDEIYGQLTSRIYRSLLCYGRLTIAALQHHTRLSLRQIKHGLSVLIQQHLVYWHTGSEDEPAAYEADTFAACNLARSGKYIKIAEDRIGVFAGAVISNLLLLGHARVGDLVQAYGVGYSKDFTGRLASTIGLPSQTVSKGSNSAEQTNRVEEVSIEKIHQTLCDLLQAGVVTVVHESHYRSHADNRTEAEKVVPPVGEYKAKTKVERDALYEIDLKRKLDEWKYGTNAQSIEIESLRKGTKRPLEDADNSLPVEKRQRLYLPLTKKYVGLPGNINDSNIFANGYLKNELVLRINHEKFAVMMRNDQLVRYADQTIGTPTSKVYKTLLRKLEPRLRACREISAFPYEEDDMEDVSSLPHISTEEVVAAMAQSFELADAMGKVDDSKINGALSDHPKKRRKKEPDDTEEDDISTDEGDSSDANSSDNASDISHDSDYAMGEADYDPHPNHHLSPPPHYAAIRSHLLLLLRHPLHYLHHIPSTPTQPEKWTIKYRPLIASLSQTTLIQTIASRYGMPSARLAKICAEKGKLDDKTLCALSLISQKEMRNRLLALQKAGLLELQEVPRDNARVASRTNFLYYFDEERCKARVLEESYKTMVRLLQRAEVERERVKGVVEKASRSDVVGREAELLGEGEQKALKTWRMVEERIWGELGRVDEVVGLLRDF